MSERIFSQSELEDLGKRTLDLLDAAIDNGDTDQAKFLAQRMYAEFSAMHDLYINWVSDLLTHIGERHGDEDLYQALEKSVGTFIKALGFFYAGKSLKRRIQMLAAGLRGHLQPFSVMEDDEKFTITSGMCGSGGRLVQMKAYDAPRNCLRVSRAQDMTFNRADFPVYCAHCYFQNIIPLGPDLGPLCITEPPEKIGSEPCLAFVYK
ncbi:MAG: hypothetical protein KKB20_09895 [Proteobacteria bacterium]|nr:hypothetical protein [Pseudomonadota bacterium]